MPLSTLMASGVRAATVPSTTSPDLRRMVSAWTVPASRKMTAKNSNIRLCGMDLMRVVCQKLVKAIDDLVQIGELHQFLPELVDAGDTFKIRQIVFSKWDDGIAQTVMMHG